MLYGWMKWLFPNWVLKPVDIGFIMCFNTSFVSAFKDVNIFTIAFHFLTHSIFLCTGRTKHMSRLIKDMFGS